MSFSYAIIGCGRISPNHIAAALNCGFKIVALCDKDVSAADRIISKYHLGSVAKYSEYTAMLKEQKIDIVSIATPSGSHAEIAIACCENGIHTIIEKPVALSIHDALLIQQASQKSGVNVTVCHQNRYNPAVVKAMEFVRSGLLGTVYCVNANVLWNRGRDYYESALWRGTWEHDGGVLMNQGIHNIDLMRWFAGGTVKCVAAFIKNVAHPYIETEDLGSAIIKFDNGCIGTVNCTSNIYPANLEESLYILGSAGTIKLSGKSVNTIEVLSVDGLQNPDQIKESSGTNPPNVYGYGHTPLFEDFATSITDGVPPYIALQEAIDSLELVLGIYKASKENCVVDFPVVDFSTIEMKGNEPWSLKG